MMMLMPVPFVSMRHFAKIRIKDRAQLFAECTRRTADPNSRHRVHALVLDELFTSLEHKHAN